MTTRKEILQRQERFAAYKKRYKNYPGSPGDDALVGIYGYAIREERSYINYQLTQYKKILVFMNKTMSMLYLMMKYIAYEEMLLRYS